MVRRSWHYLPLILAVVLATLPTGQAWGNRTMFFPGQAFCPPRAMVVGRVIIRQQQCFSVFVMRTSQSAFLGFVPAGLFFTPLGQIISLGSTLGGRIRASTILLLPIAIPVFFMPVNALRLEAFQVEDMGGTMGVRLAGDPDTKLPITPISPLENTSSFSSNASAIPLPSDLLILPPGPDVPRDEAAFSGRWRGRWKGHGESVAEEGLPHVLAIKQITHDDRPFSSEMRAIVVFAWGQSSDRDVFPGWLQAEGVFRRGILQLPLSGGTHASYRMGIDGTLEGTYESPDFGTMRATLSRMH